jgi:hypothetical protein
MTLKGAYLSTYRLLWPFKQIQLARRNRKADRVLRELGFGDLDTLRRHQRPRVAVVPVPRPIPPGSVLAQEPQETPPGQPPSVKPLEPIV